jgi:ABC-2 type transport system permease protein
MLRLLKIDILKNKSYKAFIIMVALYFVTLGIVTASGMEFLKWIASLGADFDGMDIMKVPLYHFPDIWHNLAYVSTFFKFILAIVIIISITNEYSFKTVRQNVLDGFDRKDFLTSKVLMIGLLSLAATVFLFLISLTTGLIYTPSEDLRFITKDTEFMFGFFLETFTYLLFALMVGTLVQRSGLAIGLLFLYTLILEPILTFNLPDAVDAIIPYFPMRAMNEVVKLPFTKYAFMEIRDYLSIESVVTIIAYGALWIYLTYLMLRTRDLQ